MSAVMWAALAVLLTFFAYKTARMGLTYVPLTLIAVSGLLTLHVLVTCIPALNHLLNQIPGA
jgi:uncharacterized membrane protein (UPF0136 family)